MVVALVTVVALSACKVDISVDVVVDRNGSGLVTVTMTADKDITDQVPNLADDLMFDDLVDVGWRLEGPANTKSGGLRVVLVHSFNTPSEATKLLNSLNGDKGPFLEMLLIRTGKSTDSTFTLSGRLEVTGRLNAFADDALTKLLGSAPYAGTIKAANLDVGDAVSVVFNAELPGDVKTTSGIEIENSKAHTWRSTFDGGATQINLTTQNKDLIASIAGIGRVALIVLLVGWLLFCGILALLVVRAQHRRKQRATPPA